MNIEPEIPSNGRHAEHIPVALRLLIILPAFALPIYWGFTYSGPYRWLSELQQNLIDGYDPIVTGLVVFLLAAAVAIGILFVLIKILKLPAQTLTAGTLTAGKCRTWLVTNQGTAILLFAAACLTGFGLCKLLPALSVGDKTEFTVAAFAGGRTPNSRFVELTQGYTKSSYSVSVERELGGKMTPIERYMPLVEARWNSSEQVFVFIKVKRHDESEFARRRATGVYAGTLSKSLPAAIEDRMEQEGLSSASPHWVLHFNQNPSEARNEGLVITLMGLVLALLGTIVMVVKWRRKVVA